jgi:hypothetical protein
MSSALHAHRRVVAGLTSAALALFVIRIFEGTLAARDGDAAIESLRLVKVGVTPPLRHIPPLPPQAGPKREIPLRSIPSSAPTQTDGALQTTIGPALSATQGPSFAGVGDGDYGYAVSVAPPDTNGAVGDTQYVQWVNLAFAVFDKSTGALLYGPADGNTLWGDDFPCGWTNDGDPIIQFDKAAHRWVFTQLSYSLGYYVSCFAVSTGPDLTAPTTTFNKYVLQFPNLNDYPKMGVWPDGLYMSFNMFKPGFFTYTFVGARICALDKAAMYAGSDSAGVLCAQLGSSYDSLLPCDLDGSTAPPDGAPNCFFDLGKNALRLWKFHADFVNPNNATVTGPISLPVASFSKACGGGSCVPQPGTSQKLDTLGDRLMYRAAYRNFKNGSPHESVVLNHSVSVGGGKGSVSTVGVRWYEVRNPSSSPTVFQQGTFSPDKTYRWMGSIAMDGAGNIAVGYSASSSSVFPGISFTGRCAGDTAGVLRSETVLTPGNGSQTGGLSRWGDYSSIGIDPGDDSTFWYTNEYLKSNGSFNWSTLISSFKLTCP